MFDHTTDQVRLTGTDDSTDPRCASGQRRRAGTVRLAAMRERWRAAEVARDPEAVDRVATLASRAVEALGSLVWGDLGDDEAMSTVLELETSRRRLDAVLAAGLAHLDAHGITARVTGLSTHSWLGHTTKASRAAGKRDVQIGRTLVRFPGFAAAVGSGELSCAHLAALDAVSNPRIAELLIDSEATLLEMAHATTYEAFVRNLRVIARRLDTDGAEPDCSETDEIAVSVDGRGALHLSGRFTGHQGTVMERALRAELDRQMRAAGREHREAGTTVPSAGVLRARALVDLVRRGLAGDPDTSVKPRTEAIIEIRADQDGHLLPVHSIDGEPLDTVTAAVLACDTWLHPVVTDVDGTPLFAGRGARYVTAEQRRALIIRDGGCVFPGCDAPASWCDAHHVIFFEHLGDTDIDNLALLCRRHHGLAHSDDWTLEAIPLHLQDPARYPRGAIRLLWHAPDGHTIDAQTAHTSRGSGRSRSEAGGPGDEHRSTAA